MTKGRVILGAIVVIAVIIAGVSFMMKTSAEKTVIIEALDKAKLIYERGEGFLKTGEKDKALHAFEVVVTQYPDSGHIESSLRKAGAIYLEKEKYAEADQYYSRLLRKFPNAPDAKEIQSSLEKIAKKLMTSPVMVEGSVVHEVQSGDSLYSIAKKYGTTVELIKKMNNLSGDVIRKGQKLNVTTSTFSIFVDKSDNILVLKKDDKAVKSYIVATGKNNSTPVGTFTIVDKLVKPAWTKPGVGVIQPDSPEYELGERWIPISCPGIGIHGTNDDSSIGKQSTSGCVRMLNKDVIELYDIVPKGTKVEIVD